jgi:carboxymethylenebutenolidase
VKERTIEIETPDGRMESFVVHPDGDLKYPCVVLYMDVWGLREELYDLARKISVVGYYCIVPDLYYRFGRYRNEYRNEKNEMMSYAALNPEQQKRVLEPLNMLTDEMSVKDTKSIVAFALNGEEPVKKDGMGAIGYCLGGRLVIKVMGTYPDRFIAGATMHGTSMVTDASDSAHLFIKNMEGELYLGFAEHDHYATPEMIAAIEGQLKKRGLRYALEFHEGADHGYALPNRDIFHKAAYNRDWAHIFAMFHRQIPPGFAS